MPEALKREMIFSAWSVAAGWAKPFLDFAEFHGGLD